MKTILYKEIFTTKNLSWKYYVNQLDFKLFGENEDCIDNENSMFFLKNFIIESGKSKTKLFDDISDLEKKPERVNHIMSTYFLGIYFYENHPLINESIKKEVLELQKFMDKQNKGKECKHNSSFLFIWFLICLFHDLGYKYENDTSVYKDLDVFRSDNEIDVDLITKDKGVPKVIQYNYKKYFEYRLKYHGKNDHGICAGLLLYNDLCKIRKSKEDTLSDLCWTKPIEIIYNYASWVILAHNIYFVKENSIESTRYKKHKLKSLILKDNAYKIKLDKHPFLFLFGLVDTIEPLKRVKKFSLLDKIKIELTDEKIILKSELKCGCNDTIINNVSILNDWLTPVEKINNCCVEILLKKKF